MKKTIIFIVLATLCPIFRLSAQTATQITGRVVTASDGKALPGATISIKNSNTSVQASPNGTFTLSAKAATGILLITYTGYQSQEISFNGNLKNLEINMLESTGSFDDIQVIGYGKTTKRLNTGSISSINAKQIGEQPVTNVLSALSGRMPGVFIQTTNGLPGGNINVQIRGKGSLLAGTNPLYIIDGVPFDGNSPNTATSTLAGNNLTGNLSPLNNLNPSDIETITVLKDGDATSIYGSRGANGVILITTKKGAIGKTKVDLNITSGISTIAQKPQLLNLQEYLQMRREAFANAGQLPSADPLSPAYAPDLTVWSQDASTDWTDYIFGSTARSTELQGKVSGGSAQNRFTVAANYRSESIVLPGSNHYTRSGLTSQFQHRSEDGKLSIDLSNQISIQSSDLSNPVQGFTNTYLIAPNFPIYLSDGSFNWRYGINIEAAMAARSKVSTENLISSLGITYTLLDGLNLQLNTGYTRSAYDQKLIFPTRSLLPGTINSTNYGKNNLQTAIIEPQLNYGLKLGKSSLTFLAGGTFQYKNTQNEFISTGNYKLESLMEDLASAGTIDGRSNVSLPYKYASLFARATYSLGNSYVLNATARRDGSSRFGPGNRFGNFGSVGAAWIISNSEAIKRNLPFLSLGKLRFSYGTTGNDQIQDYQYTSTYSSPGTGIYQDVAVIRPNRISNDNFHWESTAKMDIALELGFLNDRIVFTADYYYNKSSNQLISYTLPAITGFSSYQANLPAVILNKGLELSAEAKLIDKNNLSWSANFNITFPVNMLKSFENFQSSAYANLYELGYDIGRIKGYRYLGVNPSSGEARYAGIDGTTSTTPYDNFTLGKTTPQYYGGFGSQLNWKGINLGIFVQFTKQTGLGSIPYNPGASVYNTFSAIADRWTAANPNAAYPKASTVYDVRFANSSLNVFDTSYLRIKNISLSYSLKEAFTKKIGLKNLRIYAEGQNLFTVSSKNAAVLDPESGGSTSSFARNFPSLKTVVLGLQLSL